MEHEKLCWMDKFYPVSGMIDFPVNGPSLPIHPIQEIVFFPPVHQPK